MTRVQVLCGALLLLLLTGCSGIGSSPNHAPNVVGELARPYAAPQLAQALPSKNVLYVSDILDSRIGIYPLNTNNPPPIGEIIQDVDTPTGIALDSASSLYVANNTTRSVAGIKKGMTNFVTVYPKGTGSPNLFYTLDVHHPTDVAVGTDGTVYVASFGDGYVTEYPPGSQTPSLHFQAPSGSAIAVALDAQNNLYVACTNSNAVYEFPPGSTVGTNLGLVLGGEPHGIAFDTNGNLVVAVSRAPNGNSVIDVFGPGQTQPKKQITGTFQPFMVAFDHRRAHLYVADFGSGNHDGGVFEFAYPSGTLLNKYATGEATGAYGVVASL